MKFLARHDYIRKINKLIQHNPVVALIGPRQVGKTTLAREIAKEHREVTFFDLENPVHQARLNDPMLALESLRGLIIIDEVQHQPDLFKVLRVLADEPHNKRKFLILGSASPVLLKQTSESLAGRIAYLKISELALQEVGIKHLTTLWVQGGFPRSYLAGNSEISYQWRQDFIKTFLERDLPQLGINIPAVTMRRFWMMLAHYHGQIWNNAEFSRAFGMSDKTVRHYLDILTSTFVIRQLAPWWENISKRQVKSPKIYLEDTGILHALLGLENEDMLQSHPKVGASWEGFALTTIMKQLDVNITDCFFWSTHSGAELDLFVPLGNKRLGFEFKRSSSVKLTASLNNAITDLKLTHAYIIHAGNDIYPLSNKVTAIGLKKIDEFDFFKT